MHFNIEAHVERPLRTIEFYLGAGEEKRIDIGWSISRLESPDHIGAGSSSHVDALVYVDNST